MVYISTLQAGTKWFESHFEYALKAAYFMSFRTIDYLFNGLGGRHASKMNAIRNFSGKITLTEVTYQFTYNKWPLQ